MRKSDVADRLHSSAIRLLRLVRREDAQMDLSPARASVLSILVFAGAKSPGELAGIEQVAAPTMTKLINALERDGYVGKRRNRKDGRGVMIVPTRKAKRTLQRGRQRRVEALRLLFSDLSEAEWSILEQAVALIDARVRRRRAAGSM